eukprot:gene8780-1573_t
MLQPLPGSAGSLRTSENSPLDNSPAGSVTFPPNPPASEIFWDNAGPPGLPICTAPAPLQQQEQVHQGLAVPPSTPLGKIAQPPPPSAPAGSGGHDSDDSTTEDPPRWMQSRRTKYVLIALGILLALVVLGAVVGVGVQESLQDEEPRRLVIQVVRTPVPGDTAVLSAASMVSADGRNAAETTPTPYPSSDDNDDSISSQALQTHTPELQ